MKMAENKEPGKRKIDMEFAALLEATEVLEALNLGMIPFIRYVQNNPTDEGIKLVNDGMIFLKKVHDYVKKKEKGGITLNGQASAPAKGTDGEETFLDNPT